MVSRPPVASPGFDSLSLALGRLLFPVALAALPLGRGPRFRSASRIFGCRFRNVA